MIWTIRGNPESYIQVELSRGVYKTLFENDFVVCSSRCHCSVLSTACRASVIGGMSWSG